MCRVHSRINGVGRAPTPRPNNGNNNLQWLSWNCASMNQKKNVRAIMAELSQSDYKVVMLQETMTKKPPLINGFERFFEPSQTSNPSGTNPPARGLATYVHKSLAAKRAATTTPICQEAETLAVKVFTPNGEQIELVNNYISPSVKPKKFNLDQYFAKNVLLGGDLNAVVNWDNDPNYYNGNNHESIRRGKLLKRAHDDSPSILPINKDAGWTCQMNTRNQSVSHSQVDHMFISTQLSSKYDVNEVATTEPLSAGQNFHKMLTAKVEVPMATDRDSFVPSYKWNKWDTQTYTRRTEHRFEQIYNSNDYKKMSATERYKLFSKVVLEVVDETVPKTKWCSSPWKSFFWNARCEEAKKKYKDALTKGIGNVEEARLELAEILEEEKTKAWSEVYESVDLSRHPEEGWKKIKNIRNGGNLPKYNLRTSQEETEELARQFRDRTDPRIGLTPEIRQSLENNAPQRRINIDIAKNTPNEQQDKPLDPQVLNTYLDRKPQKTATGQDKISYSMMHFLGFFGRLILYEIIQASWEEGALVTSWKHAEIVPIPKKDGSKRPISLLEVVGKLAERLVKARLDDHLPEPQSTLFGFERERGCQDALMTLREMSEPSKHSKVLKAIIYVDFEKAFEIAQKEVILDILAGYNIQGKLLTWLEDFLTNRTAHVRNKQYISQPFECLAGTPQGSILSPTLFNVIMNKLVTLLRESTDASSADKSLPLNPLLKNLSYADDLALCYECRKHLVIIEGRKIMKALERFCVLLGLKINADKTKWQIFHHGGPCKAHRDLGKFYYPDPKTCRKLNQPEVYSAPALALSDGSPIEKVTSFPYLGIIFQSNRNFRQSCLNRQAKSSGALGTLRAAVNKGKGVSTKSALMFATSSVGSMVNYGGGAVCEPDFDRSGGLAYERNPELRSDMRKLSPVENSLSISDGRFCNALRTALAVSNRVPTEVIFLETGRYPLPILRQIEALKSVVKAIYTCRPHALDIRINAHFRNVDKSQHIFTYLSRLVKTLKDMGVRPLDKPGRREIKHPRIECDLHIPKFFDGRKEDQDPALLRIKVLEYICTMSNGSDLVMYTDGSVDPVSGQAGSAAIARRSNSTVFEWKVRARNNASSTETELIAIHGAVSETLNFLDRDDILAIPTKVIIFTDSQGAIQILSRDENDEHIELLHAIKMKVEELIDLTPLEIHWIPSHIGIAGNEAADKLAKEASQMDGPIYDPYYGVIPKSQFIRQITRWRHQAYHEFALNKLETRPSLIRNWYKLLNPDGKPFAHPDKLTRPEEQVITECRLMQFAVCKGCGNRTACGYCGAPASTSHYLLECNKSRGLVKRFMNLNPPRQLTAFSLVRNETEQNQLQLQLDALAAASIREISKVPEPLLNCVRRIPIATRCTEPNCSHNHKPLLVDTRFHTYKICDFAGSG